MFSGVYGKEIVEDDEVHTSLTVSNAFTKFLYSTIEEL
jgi:hypothetical protein